MLMKWWWCLFAFVQQPMERKWNVSWQRELCNPDKQINQYYVSFKQCLLPQTRYAEAPNWSQYIFQAKQKPSFVDQHLVWQLCNLWRGMVHEGAPLQVYIRSRKLRNKCRARVWSNTSMQQTSAISYSTKLESEDVRPNLHARRPPKV